MSTTWDDVRDRIHEIARGAARKHAPRRFKVTGTSPLTAEAADSGDEVIEEGDEDVEIDERVLAQAAEDDLVIVHHDHGGNFLITGLVKDE